MTAETSRPETGAGFARRMAGRFVLLGPDERKKGEGEGAKLSSVAPVTRDNQTSRIAERTKSANIDIETAKTAGENTEQRRNGIENIPVTYLHESGLQREAKRSVLERPVLQTDT